MSSTSLSSKRKRTNQEPSAEDADDPESGKADAAMQQRLQKIRGEMAAAEKSVSRGLDSGGTARTRRLMPVFQDRFLKMAQKVRARKLFDEATAAGGDGEASLSTKVLRLAKGKRFRSDRAWTPQYAERVGLHVGIPGRRVTECYAQYKVMFRAIVGDIEDDAIFDLFSAYSLED